MGETGPAHAKLSPSSASSWMTCADYPNANEGLPDDESEFAREGTIAHEVSDMCLLTGADAYDFIGMKTRYKEWSFVWDEEDAELLQPGIDWTREQPGEFFGEHRVDLSKWLGPNQFGTLDRGIVSHDLITISDLKWGRGIAVSPVRNKQLQLYALGFWDKVARHISKATRFRIIIDQPRNSAGGGEWETTLDELLAFGEQARAAAEATRQPNPPRTASADGCLWCKRKNQPPAQDGDLTGCATFDKFNLELWQSEFEDLDIGTIALPVKTLTAERRAVVIQHTTMMKKWLDQIYGDALDDALMGRPTGGLKAVEGKGGRRAWKDKIAAEAAVVSLLGDKSFTKKLITPTQCGKTISSEDYKKYIESHVVRPDPKPILVSEDDARPAMLAADEFDDLD